MMTALHSVDVIFNDFELHYKRITCKPPSNLFREPEMDLEREPETLTVRTFRKDVFFVRKALVKYDTRVL